MKKHKLLKLRARDWLHSLGYRQVQYEKPFLLPPDHPEWENEQLVKLDVFAVHPNGSTIGIECGYVDSDKARKLSSQLDLLMVWPHERDKFHG